MKYLVRWWRFSRSVYPFEGVKMTERVTEDQSRVYEYEVELEAGKLEEARERVEKEDSFAKITLVCEKPEFRYYVPDGYGRDVEVTKEAYESYGGRSGVAALKRMREAWARDFPHWEVSEAEKQSFREISTAKDAVFAAALVVGRHWNDQEGVNGSHLDTLSAATVAYDRAVTSWKLRAGGMYGKDASRGRRSAAVDVVCDGGSGELVARGDGVDEHSDDSGVREDDAEGGDGA